MQMNRGLMLLGVSIFLISCGLCSWAGPKVKSGEKQSDVNNPAFHQGLLDAAKHYKTFDELDDRARLAPALCSSPNPALLKPLPRLSKSDDGSSHGKKLYFLYLKDRESYVALHAPAGAVVEKKDSAGQQVIVKESWIPKSVPGDAPLGLGVFQPKLEPDVQSALFVMLKTAPGTPDTDDGWVYGTVTPDGKTVTSAGRVQSCMACHQAAPYGRLFGVEAWKR